MSTCEKIKAEGIKTIKNAYDPIIAEYVRIIENMRQAGADPTRWYNPATNQVINLVKLVEDITRERNDDLNDMRQKIDDECYEPNEAALQQITDLAVTWFTNGLALVLPEHMTHIDIREILDGKPLGGENSVFNVAKETMFDAVGIGKNHELRKITDTPIQTIEDTGRNVEREVRRVLRRLGIKL